MQGFFQAQTREQRREFLTRLAAFLGICTTSLGRGLAELESDFVWARLRTATGDWFTDMKNEGMEASADLNLLRRVREQTNLKAAEVETVIDATREDLEKNPLIYLTGHQQFTLPEKGDEEIAKVLRRGGFLLMDDCAGRVGEGFDLSATALVRGMFPDQKLEPLPIEHPLFHCFFDFQLPAGATAPPPYTGSLAAKPCIEGITLQGRTPLVLCTNDLGCGWEGHPCTPGGEEQRVDCFRLGINMIFYALTS